MKVRRIVPDLHGDPQASRAFWEDVIGLELGMDLGWVIGFQSPSNETAQIIVMSEDATAPVSPNVTVEVGDVDAVHAKAVEHDCEIVHPLTDEPWGARRFFVRDPSGAVINVQTSIQR
jgi:catechol 2,3-dioxygenase-like lactoylglutathione lyase family enzyme